MKRLYIQTSTNGQNTFSIPVSDTIAAVMMTGANKTVTVPTGASYAVFSCSDDFYLKIGATAAVPTVDVSTGAAELNPAVRTVNAGEVINVIGASGILTISFFN